MLVRRIRFLECDACICRAWDRVCVSENGIELCEVLRVNRKSGWSRVVCLFFIRKEVHGNVGSLISMDLPSLWVPRLVPYVCRRMLLSFPCCPFLLLVMFNSAIELTL